MRRIYTIALMLFAVQVNAQNVIEWDGTYQLQMSDFQSKVTQIGGVNLLSVNPATTMDFAFHMGTYEFMLTKNFNSKVNCYTKRDASSIMAPDSATAYALLDYARYNFDLTELYARKLRKRLYEEKGAFSEVSFFQPIFDEVHGELQDAINLAGKETDMGRDKEKLAEMHKLVLQKIDELSDFCKKCKPSKKKSKKA